METETKKKKPTVGALAEQIDELRNEVVGMYDRSYDYLLMVGVDIDNLARAIRRLEQRPLLKLVQPRRRGIQ
jgi:hypothetical protein